MLYSLNYDLITLPTNQFFDTFRPIIVNVVHVVGIIIPAAFLAYFCWGLVKSYTVGDFRAIPHSLLQSVIILMFLIYMFPAFTLAYNAFNDLSLTIFPMKDLIKLNHIYDIFLKFTSDPENTDFRISVNGFVTAIMYLATKFLLFITRCMYIFVFEYVRDILLFTSLFTIPFFLVFSFFETPRNAIISIIKMMVELLFWLPLLCFFLCMIYEYNPSIGKSNWIVSTENNLYVQLTAENASVYMSEFLGKTFLFFLCTFAVPLLGHIVFSGNALSASSTIFGGGLVILRSAAHQLSRVASSITHVINPFHQANSLIKSNASYSRGASYIPSTPKSPPPSMPSSNFNISWSKK